MSLAKILLCLDTDPQPSVFDAVVAVDAEVDQLLRHGGVTPDDVRNLVYGAMFTRGPQDLKNTAVFIGGSDVAAGEKLLARARECFFGPMRVSLMLDSNGANTTAAAAVLCARKHVSLADTTGTVLAATGSVGRRVVRLLAREGASVRVASRQLRRAQQVCDEVRKLAPEAKLEAWETRDVESVRAAVDGAAFVVAAGAPAAELLPEGVRRATTTLKLAIDLNAVPPTGIGGIQSQDKAVERDGQICYGAIGVGGTKMKLHKAAVRRLFESNDLVLDAEEIYALGGEI
ncbi:MAG: methylenetetrahydromethanopterin dehydrogenase [Planctomycetes bacterium]|nr:methylenetetrahydromethanopterin dehydrogenase [Planctomycetota bacterium]